MGFRANAAINATTQALQQAEAHRRRADQLAVRNRRLRAVTASALAATVIGMVAMLAVGVLIGYSVGVGLIGAVR
jgi:hypothetical protein